MIVIGDVHGKTKEYFKIADKYEYTVQVGDFGFSPAWHNLEYSGLDYTRHKVIPGNHDDYDVCMQSKYCLGDYGVAEVEKRFFFVRGGISIDDLYRRAEHVNTGKKTWWIQEQLNYQQMVECEAEYEESDTDILITHCPPMRIIPALHKSNTMLEKFGFPANFVENTAILIDRLVYIRPPKVCVFGHHHKSLDKIIGGTRYIGLNELEEVYI